MFFQSLIYTLEYIYIYIPTHIYTTIGGVSANDPNEQTLSLMIFSSDGTHGNVHFWCFPLDDLNVIHIQRKALAKQTNEESKTISTDSKDPQTQEETISQTPVSPKEGKVSKMIFDHLPLRTSGMFINPAKKQIAAYAYLPRLVHHTYVCVYMCMCGYIYQTKQ